MSASIGIALGGGTSAEELLREADIAMYRAKWDGKNRYAVFETGMQDTIQKRAWSSRWTCATRSRTDEFFLAYQPTFALSDMSPTGVEALIRWKHPVRGVVPPDEFIPLARGDRADHRDRQVGARRGLLPGRRVAQRPDIRSAWPSTSRRASSTAIS